MPHTIKNISSRRPKGVSGLQLTVLVSAPVFRSTVAWLKNSTVTTDNFSCLDPLPMTARKLALLYSKRDCLPRGILENIPYASTRVSSSLDPKAGWNCRGAPKKGWVMVKEVRLVAAIGKNGMVVLAGCNCGILAGWDV